LVGNFTFQETFYINIPLFQETYTVHIYEPAVAPRLYLNSDHVLGAGSGEVLALHTGVTALGFEGNSSAAREVGTVLLCDVNRGDALKLLWRNLDTENVHYDITEVMGRAAGAYDEDYDDMVSMCLQTNIR
jgi:hypothetical protein